MVKIGAKRRNSRQEESESSFDGRKKQRTKTPVTNYSSANHTPVTKIYNTRKSKAVLQGHTPASAPAVKNVHMEKQVAMKKTRRVTPHSHPNQGGLPPQTQQPNSQSQTQLRTSQARQKKVPPPHVEHSPTTMVHPTTPEAEDGATSQPMQLGEGSCIGSSKLGKRGFTRPLPGWSPSNKMALEFNEFWQPIGDNEAKLSTQLGILARRADLAPINYPRWDCDGMKEWREKVWIEVQKNTTAPDEYKDICLMKVGDMWKRWKAKLRKFMRQYSTTQERLANCPSRVHVTQWPGFVSNEEKENQMAVCERNKKNRLNLKMPHITGRRSHAVVRNKMEKEKGGKVSRMDVFVKTRTRENDTPSDEVAGEKMITMTRMYKELPEEEQTDETQIKDGIYDTIMGPDKNGRVRTYGFGVCPSQVRGTRLTKRASQSTMAFLRENVNRQVAEEVNRRVSEEMKKVYKKPRQNPGGACRNADDVDMPDYESPEGDEFEEGEDGDDQFEECESEEDADEAMETSEDDGDDYDNEDDGDGLPTYATPISCRPWTAIRGKGQTPDEVTKITCAIVKEHSPDEVQDEIPLFVPEPAANNHLPTENAPEGSNNIGTTWDNCGKSPARSVNITEIAAMLDGVRYDQDEVGSGPSLVTVHGYRVREQVASLLGVIIEKYGDIAEKCTLKGKSSRSTQLEVLCGIVQKLKRLCFKEISSSELETIRTEISDLASLGLDVGWLQQRVEMVSKAKSLFLGAATLMEKRRDNREEVELHKKEFEKLEKEIEEMVKRSQAEAEKIEKLKAEGEEIEEMVAETKLTLKGFLGGESLVEGLL